MLINICFLIICIAGNASQTQDTATSVENRSYLGSSTRPSVDELVDESLNESGKKEKSLNFIPFASCADSLKS